MPSTQEELEAFLARALAPLGVELFDVELRQSNLVVTVERPAARLDLDEVAEAARVVSNALDERSELAPEGHYELEVTTPGLERRLRHPRHFHGALGEVVALRLVPGVEGPRRLEGRLRAADDEGVDLDLEGGEARRVAYGAIERAHTVFDWKAALAAPRGNDDERAMTEERR